ncbi:MAG: hypothetical protein PHQ23_06660 [Candidatus Wallbacteria bacterium]|nr:hypothetical protein [Candidatus Wallbacteria bacterium]
MSKMGGAVLCLLVLLAVPAYAENPIWPGEIGDVVFRDGAAGSVAEIVKISATKGEMILIPLALGVAGWAIGDASR